jgi:hypothetical protein
MLLGPQGEPLLTDAELRAYRVPAQDPDNEPADDRDVSADGVGFGPVKVPDSPVASGTDRDIVEAENAVLVGPQGEKIYPTADGICPACGQQFPEECSQPGEDLDVEPGATPDFDNINELSA